MVKDIAMPYLREKKIQRAHWQGATPPFPAMWPPGMLWDSTDGAFNFLASTTFLSRLSHCLVSLQSLSHVQLTEVQVAWNRLGLNGPRIPPFMSAATLDSLLAQSLERQHCDANKYRPPIPPPPEKLTDLKDSSEDTPCTIPIKEGVQCPL